MSKTISGWKMTGPKTLVPFEVEAQAPKAGWVRVKVIGCGVCHTDIGYLYDGVPTKHALPLVLGHEIAGVVVAAGDGAQQWLGRRVVVPAVAPCGECALLQARASVTACRASKMPGNDHDGGFATHVDVPAPRPLPGRRSRRRRRTRRAARPGGAAALGALGARRRGLHAAPGDAPQRPAPAATSRWSSAPAASAATAVQIAKAFGATVVALDIDPAKLERAKALGADAGRSTRARRPRS